MVFEGHVSEERLPVFATVRTQQARELRIFTTLIPHVARQVTLVSVTLTTRLTAVPPAATCNTCSCYYC